MINVAEGDSPLFIDYEDRSLRDSRKRTAGAKYTIALRNFSMREKITAKRKMELSGFHLLKSHMAIYGVNANAHDLGITLGKVG